MQRMAFTAFLFLIPASPVPAAAAQEPWVRIVEIQTLLSFPTSNRTECVDISESGAALVLLRAQVPAGAPVQLVAYRLKLTEARIQTLKQEIGSAAIRDLPPLGSLTRVKPVTDSAGFSVTATFDGQRKQVGYQDLRSDDGSDALDPKVSEQQLHAKRALKAVHDWLTSLNFTTAERIPVDENACASPD